MATFDQLAKKYATRIRNADDEDAALESVAEDINSLYYVDNQGRLTERRVTAADRRFIAERVGEHLKPPETPGRMAKEADNKHYLAVVRALKLLLG